jgi:zinc protease
MKKSCGILALLLPLVGMAQKTMVISGKVAASLKEHTLFFYEQKGQRFIPVDSCRIKADGSYTVQWNPAIRGTFLPGFRMAGAYAFWADDKSLNMNINEEGLPEVGGDADNALMNQVNNAIAARNAGMRTDARKAFADFRQKLETLAKENASLPAVTHVLRFFDFDRDTTLINEVTATLVKNHPAHPAVVRYLSEVTLLRPGAPAPDFSYLTLTGESKTLKSILGKAKYTLVDFWGTYCGPCRQGIPGIKKLYGEYHSKGLDVLAISLDEKDDTWQKAVQEEDMPWQQGRSIDKGRGVMETYRFNGIPYLALYNQQGNIVALALTHEALEERFRELMGAPDPVAELEPEYTSIEQTAAEKAAVAKIMARDLQADYAIILSACTEEKFRREYLRQLTQLVNLKDFQAGKLTYALPGFYQALQKVYAAKNTGKAAQQKGYEEAERKQLGFLRYLLHKVQYEKYLQYRSTNPVLAKPLPMEPGVRTGTLPNGFTYYIRRNTLPEKQVQLYLVNKVGSILEEEQERGMAHFLEHMNFNGTRHFPGNQLVDYLQKAGVRFGADLNAYTGFNETVYELPLSTKDRVVLENGFRVMRDWAKEATLDSLEIEKERGVILEEKRLGKGAKERIQQLYLPMVTNHSRYADRLPIGIDSVLTAFKPATIRHFHQTWYRPDLQALIVAGDINVDQAEQWIKTHFATLVNPVPVKARKHYEIPLTGRNQFMAVTDQEITTIQLQVLTKHKVQVLQTEYDYLESVKKNLFSQVLHQRLFSESSQLKDPAFVQVTAGIQPLMGGVEMFSFDVTAKEGQLQPAFQQGWRMMERIQQYGFTQPELDRARQSYLRSMEKAMQEQDKMPSKSYVSAYQQHFLQGMAAPGIAWEYRFVKEHINAITLADLDQLLKAYTKPVNRDILVQGPESQRQQLPDEQTVNAWMGAVEKEKFVAYEPVTVTRPLLRQLPPAGKIIAAKEITALQLTELTLSNGMRIVLKPTAFKNDEIRYYAFASGGTSVYKDAVFPSAALAGRMMSNFGLGTFTPVDLSDRLSDKIITAGVYIGARSQGVFGNSAVADLETVLQLVHLQFTEPRKDSQLFVNAVNSMKASLMNRYADPGNVFNDTISYVLGNYHYRASALSFQKLNQVKLSEMDAIYRECFADASAFTFVFVGNFDQQAIRPLLEQYLGSLPALHKEVKAVNLDMKIPAGRITKIVHKGNEDKATVKLVLSSGGTVTPLNQLLLNALGEILEMKLLNSLREKEGEVYSPSVKSSVVKYPDTQFVLQVGFGCAPANVDHLVTLVQQEIDQLIKQGPNADELLKYKTAQLKNTELALQTNDFWLGYLSGQYESKEDLLQILSYKKYMDQVTPVTMKQAAARYLGGKNLAKFILLPELSPEHS